MNNSYIGIIDSGLGGLTTVRETIRQLDENIIFLGDTRNLPYGEKTRPEIIQLTKNNIEILSAYPLKAIVIACNTSDSSCLPQLTSKTGVPIFGVIRPAAAKAAAVTKNRKVGLIATSLTIRLNKYTEYIHSFDKDIAVFCQATPKLVPMIEAGTFIHDREKLKETLREYLKTFAEAEIDTIILGCTHYDVLDDMILELLPGVNVVSSSKEVVYLLKDYLINNDLLNQDKIKDRKYFVTSDPSRFQDVASLLIEDISIQQL